MRTSLAPFLALTLLAALGAAFSCKTFDVPGETCDPSKQHGGELMTPLSDATCDRCLEDSCCDAVGVCERTEGCPEAVSGVHACVLREGLAGARNETACAETQKLGELPEADTAYRCMRDRCGAECGLPVCRVDPAALLIQSANCDACFASSCCPQLNECYASRACKLTIECIVQECGPTLGNTLTPGILNGAPDAGMGTFNGQDLCAADGGMHPGGPPACIQKCLCAFKDNDQGLAPAELAKRPVNLALAVYQCGVSAGCASSCTEPTDAARP
jgi:hypothetical protein